MNKHIIRSFFGAAILILGTMVSYGQSNSLAELLNQKDFTTISSLMGEELDLCVMDDTQINTKTEAIDRIKTFFEANPIQKFETLHIGQADGSGSKYNVYKLVVSDKVIRAFVYFEKEDNKSYIRELRFDKF